MGEVQTRGPGTKSLAWSPDGRTLAVASGHSLLLVHVETNAVRATLTGHEAPILALAFAPDGQRLLSGGWDQNVRVWDPVAAIPVATYDWQRGKVHSIAVAPDGMTAAAACDKGIVLWDLDD
jgi:WD40 repeat protein